MVCSSDGTQNGVPIFQRVVEYCLESVRDIAGSYVEDIIVGTDQPTTSTNPTVIADSQLDSQIQTLKVQPDFTGEILTEIPSKQPQHVSTSPPEELQTPETLKVTQTLPTTTPFKN